MPRSDARAPIEATIPGTPESTTGAVVVAGRVDSEIADAARLVTSDGGKIALALQPGGFFVVELSDSESQAARRGLTIEALDAGLIAATLDVSDTFTPEKGRLDPIAVEMVSAPGDLTRVLRFSGSVQADGATTVRLVYPDGTHVDTPLGADSQYEITLPPDRRAAFARTPGRLIALDAGGQELASRTVAAVSFWHANEGTQ